MIDIFIDEEKCTGCGECIRVCPKGPRIYRLIEKNGKKVAQVIDKSFCIGCTTCVSYCRPKAIRLERGY
ncbi:MAG: 4Fe-4S binding protein [Candidatus Methanoperedens sp.]|nr:4Fe-4S binding protein [Candidatus Methanoperedens sp.]CAG0998976.1 2-oxoglutarate ferredoxin oxidoreductase subunit delta [Methanosarcinales archaeon]